MSGLEAVKKIVETEGQARKNVEEAKTKAQQIIAKAHEEAAMIRNESISSANQKREETLKTARERAEAEARQSDVETNKLLQSYQEFSEKRKSDAVTKAVELILNS